MVTAIDLFCGAGGSSTGMVAAGVEVKMAVNHWQRAIETHATNHIYTEHDLTDIRLAHPSRYPYTDIFWASPECTNHSLAKGRKRKGINQLDLWGESKIDPAEERSRATMREVVEFAAYHRHPFVIVENVVDIRYWQFYDDWITEMLNLGYEYKTLYLNAQFFGVPQSRDRWYSVFWLKGNKTPDLEFRPIAMCARHGWVESVQSWKKSGKEWGRYGQRRQYVYRCPQCGTEVYPSTVPAAAIIDWSLPAPRIGDRDKPLKPKTIERIEAGLRKFGRHSMIADLSHPQSSHSGKTKLADDPMATQTTRQNLALIMNVAGYTHARPESMIRDTDEPMPTQTTREAYALLCSVNYFDGIVRDVDDVLPTLTTANKLALLELPSAFLTVLKGTQTAIGINQPLSTIVASASQHWLTIPPMLLNYMNNDTEPRAVDDVLLTIGTRNTPSLIIPPFLTSYYSRNDAHSQISDPMPTMTAEPRHALVLPPFITYTNHSDHRNTSTDIPIPTIMPDGHPSLVIPMRRNTQATSVNDPLSTIVASAQHHALLDVAALVNDCGFRMLEPGELKRGMSFPEEYVVLGNKREQVKQVGNAVACKVAQWIVQRCVETLQ